MIDKQQFHIEQNQTSIIFPAVDFHKNIETMDSSPPESIDNDSAEGQGIKDFTPSTEDRTTIMDPGSPTPVSRSPSISRDVPSKNIQNLPPNPSEHSQSLEQQLLKAKKDLESIVIKYARSESENLRIKCKMEELDKKLKRAIKDNESLANRIKILTNDKTNITATLNAKLAQLTVLEQRNNSLSTAQTEKLKHLEEKCSELEKKNTDMIGQIDTYKQKEAELLDFSERLSMKHLLLQNELTNALENAPDYKKQYEEVLADNTKLLETNQDCLAKVSSLEEELSKERDKYNNLVEKRAEDELSYRRRIDELENEVKVMRRKHQIAAKEIFKQMRKISNTGNTQTIKSS